MFANLLVALALSIVPVHDDTTPATAIAGFMTQLDSIAAAPYQPRANRIRDWYRDMLAPLNPRAVADKDMETLLLASMTAAGLANDRSIAEHSRAIFDEMETRSLLAEKRYVDMQQLYVNLRDFEAARAFHAKFGQSHPLDPIPAISRAAGFDPAQRSILVLQETGALQERNFSAAREDFVLAVADPLCHFTLDAATAIEADPELHAYFAEHSHWLAPYGVRLDPGPIETWNARFSDYRMVLVDDIRTWPDIDYWGTPTFYVFVQGQVVETIRGWPKGGRADELKRALGLTRTGP
ncbi:hypothetical protein QAA18_09425 [Luteimonas sp. 8-5]|uniref:hypothetical protein n=1 Tax=Luteimonas sp. 8-5 TaxID=3039387 RepID=UPI002436D4C4|nr:hypothetical protein [Luteimonas sp. 8-5]MDG6348955.1 hypothetical protein [Luteimonas sp. 8-5]